jgi:hypothetical protein
LTDTKILAIYASVLSTMTAAIQTINFYRDRRNIKMSSRRETEYFEAGGIGGAGDTWTVVVVVNKSRRPITITKVGARLLFPKVDFVSLMCKPAVPTELTEGKYLEAVADEERIDLTEIEAWEAHDALGNPYRLPVAPYLTRILSRTRRRWTKLKQ